MKLFAHFEVVGLFDGEGQGKSGFTDLMAPDSLSVYKSLNLEPTMFQPGTQITISVMECPDCKLPATQHNEGVCPCGHDWIDWCREKYKEYQDNESG